MTDAKKLKENDAKEVNGGSRFDHNDWGVDYEEIVATCSECGKPIYKGEPCGYRDDAHKTGILCSDCEKKLEEELKQRMDVGV